MLQVEMNQELTSASALNSPMASTTAESKTLTLISSDCQRFEVAEAAAVQSITIQSMVEDGYTDEPIPLPKLDAKTLSEVIVFLNKHAGDSLSAVEKATFDEGFVNVEIPLLTDYILAANYLNIPELLNLCAQKFADLIKNKSVKKVREIFGIVNDFTEEEEIKIRKQHEWAYEGVDED